MFVPPEINQPEPGHILCVGRDPGEDEEAVGKPFVGRAKAELELALAHIGLQRQEVNIANVCGWRPPNNDFRKHEEGRVHEGVAQVRELAAHLKPSLIITLGNEAAYTFIPEWPTNGRGIFGAKGIEDRRGYFWDTSYGSVLTTLHPAGVLRKLVPGRYLLQLDFDRGKRWLNGDLPRDVFPLVTRLRSPFQVEKLVQSSLVAWDIETKWDGTALTCSGYCGDDMQPLVAAWGYEFDHFGKEILLHPVPKVGHNGAAHDCIGMQKFYNLNVRNYLHDTQQMWWALEPDLAGTGDTDEEDKALRPERMTRKGLAFLCSLHFNLPWWKNYPKEDDPDYLQKMVVINGNDAYATRWLAARLLPQLDKVQVTAQYRLAVSLYPALQAMQLKGIKVNEELREARIKELTHRYRSAQLESAQSGLHYIEQQAVAAFAKSTRCSCCHGGKVLRQACWRCLGLEKKPSKKAQVMLRPCIRCSGMGRLTSYRFSPFSPVQMKQFLYEAIGAPQNVWKGKVTTDATALKKVLRWARGE